MWCDDPYPTRWGYLVDFNSSALAKRPVHFMVISEYAKFLSPNFNIANDLCISLIQSVSANTLSWVVNSISLCNSDFMIFTNLWTRVMTLNSLCNSPYNSLQILILNNVGYANGLSCRKQGGRVFCLPHSFQEAV